MARNWGSLDMTWLSMIPHLTRVLYSLEKAVGEKLVVLLHRQPSNNRIGPFIPLEGIVQSKVCPLEQLHIVCGWLISMAHIVGKNGTKNFESRIDGLNPSID